ncbi:MAG: tRNA threonylcarbamoyladenosine biosynthesis protein TsaB [Solirubrobacteraceae bacterium]|nr:tRNA threonylcarbamoyladenosine biosynthesis protein TsaB [Solirubrobacteraceae bacterium]
MIVLGFDTATPSTAVALRLADGRTSQARDDPREGEHPGHATRLLAMAADLLTSEGIRWSDVDRIAVGVGPGTFTGLRVGIATARGLAQSLSAELVGIPSLQALAAPALAALAADARQAAGLPADARAALSNPVLAVIDARRGEAFAAAYRASTAGGAPDELVAASALAPEDLGEVIATAVDRGIEPGRPWLAVGDGAVRFRSCLERLAVTVAPDSSPLHRVSAESVCELGLLAAPAPDVEAVLPDYGRRPDAEIALEAASAGGR